MAEGKGREAWQHTSAVLAMLHNTVPGMKEGDMRAPDHFNPYEKQEEKEDIEVPFDTLKVFLQPGLQ